MIIHLIEHGLLILTGGGTPIGLRIAHDRNFMGWGIKKKMLAQGAKVRNSIRKLEAELGMSSNVADFAWMDFDPLEPKKPQSPKPYKVEVTQISGPSDWASGMHTINQGRGWETAQAISRINASMDSTRNRVAAINEVITRMQGIPPAQYGVGGGYGATGATGPVGPIWTTGQLAPVAVYPQLDPAIPRSRMGCRISKSATTMNENCYSCNHSWSQHLFHSEFCDAEGNVGGYCYECLPML